MAKPKPKPTYTAEQRAEWKRKHRDYKSGGIRNGTATIMANGGGLGSIIIGLEEWYPGTYWGPAEAVKVGHTIVREGTFAEVTAIEPLDGGRRRLTLGGGGVAEYANRAAVARTTL